MAAPQKDDGVVDCKLHGQRASAIVCRHHIDARRHAVGFIENSSEPDDLQAWCLACEARFLVEGELNDAFVAFNDFAVVCIACYESLKRRHTAASA